MHIHHTLQQGMKTVEVRSVDTDVIVIFIGAFYELVKTQSSADIGCIWDRKELQIFLA